MAYELLQEKETQQTLRQMAHTVIGRPIAVQVIATAAPNGHGAAPATDSPPANENRLPLSQTQVVRDALELFGGRILDIRQRSASREAIGQPISADDMVSEEENDDE
jgi:hypothetical protein